MRCEESDRTHWVPHGMALSDFDSDSSPPTYTQVTFQFCQHFTCHTHPDSSTLHVRSQGPIRKSRKRPSTASCHASPTFLTPEPPPESLYIYTAVAHNFPILTLPLRTHIGPSVPYPLRLLVDSTQQKRAYPPARCPTAGKASRGRWRCRRV